MFSLVVVVAAACHDCQWPHCPGDELKYKDIKTRHQGKLEKGEHEKGTSCWPEQW